MNAVRTRRVLDTLMGAAEKEAFEKGYRVVSAIVDASGELLQLRRPDSAKVASARVAIDKARTAAIFMRPSREIEEQVSGGRPGARALHGAVALTGGIPLEVDGGVVGAIGVSGETPDEDEAAARVGANNVLDHAVGVSGASSADEDQELAVIGVDGAVVAANDGHTRTAAFFTNAEVSERFSTGGLLLDERGYKIDAGRRDGPGEVEYHESVVDVMRVVQGNASVLTGGTMVDPREIAAGEVRAGEVRAGEVQGATTHELSEGDVLAVPAGVPHQFIEVSEEFLYYVIKVEM